MNRRKNDILLKAAFEDTFAYLLRFFFANADSLFDFDRGFTFMDKELRELFPELEKKGGTRHADMLAKVFLRDGTERCILVHIEIQDQHKAGFAKRMFRYFYRIYDRYDVGITAIAVFSGKNKPQNGIFTEELLGTKATYEYNNYHIFDHSAEQLLAMDNPFALIVLAAQKAILATKIPETELGEARLAIAKALIGCKKFTHPQIAAFLYFLKNFLHIKNPEISAIFEQQTDLLTGKINTMGIIETVKMLEREEAWEEGREEGREETEKRKNYEFVSNLLASNKFSDAEIANFASVTGAFVTKVKKELR